MAGLLAALILLATEAVTLQAALQYADIPLGVFFLATLALLASAGGRDWPRGLMILAGLCCGFAVWTKNDGIPFVVAALCALAFRGGVRALKWTLVGAAPLFLLLAAFKLVLVAGTEAMFPKTVPEAAAKLLDVSRWTQIAASFAKDVWNLGPAWNHPLLLLGVTGFALGLPDRRAIRSQAWLLVPIAAALAADAFVYALTTADLAWHLGTSSYRLLAQLWPCILFVVFSAVKPFVEVAPEPAATARAPKRERKRQPAGRTE